MLMINARRLQRYHKSNTTPGQLCRFVFSAEKQRLGLLAELNFGRQ